MKAFRSNFTSFMCWTRACISGSLTAGLVHECPCGGVIDGGEPMRHAHTFRVSVECDVDLASASMCMGDAFAQFRFAEVQSGEGAGIGLVAKADVHRIGTVFDGRFQCRQIPGGTNQLHHDFRSGKARMLRLRHAHRL